MKDSKWKNTVTSVGTQNTIIYGDTFSSVSASTSLLTSKQQSKFKSGDSSSSPSKSTKLDIFLNIQKKRNHNKQLNISFDGTVPIIYFNDNSIPYGTNISFSTEKITKKNLYNPKCDITSSSSESDFSLMRLKKRREYSKKTIVKYF